MTENLKALIQIAMEAATAEGFVFAAVCVKDESAEIVVMRNFHGDPTVTAEVLDHVSGHLRGGSVEQEILVRTQ